MTTQTYNADEVLAQLVENGRQIPTREEVEALGAELEALYLKVKPLVKKVKFYEDELYPAFLGDEELVDDSYVAVCQKVFPDWKNQEWYQEVLTLS
jgi:hypothetical protein